MWNLPPPPGFQGLRDDLPLRVYEQALPHWRQDGATYFVTFRLHDSLPQSKLRELRQLRAEWQRRRRSPPRVDLSHSSRSTGHTLRAAFESDEQLSRELIRRVDTWLDEGMGSCVLRLPEASAAIVNCIQRGDGIHHETGCYVVMPNHVHAIVRPLLAEMPLENVLQRWKGGSACEINRLRHDSGTLWQRESFDRIIRDEEHLWRVIQYIGRNPANAGLSSAETRLWIRPSWVACGWRFET